MCIAKLPINIVVMDSIWDSMKNQKVSARKLIVSFIWCLN